jgi:hypothetical protein
MDIRQKLSMLEGRVSNYRLADEAPAAMPPELLEAIQMIKDALVVIDELTQAKDQVVKEKEEVEAQKQVAEKTAMEYKDKFDKVENEKKLTEKENFFEDVVSKGQLNPDEVDDWKLQYDKSKDFVVKILTARAAKSSIDMPKTTKTLDTKSDEVIYKGKKYKLTTEDYKIMANQKYDRNNPKDVDRYIADVLEGMEG